MLQHLCDWCGCKRANDEEWLLGFAAERIGATRTRREFHLAPAWSEAEANSRLAVHFCSEEHLRCYVAALFAQPARTAVRVGTSPSSKAATAVAIRTAPAATAARTTRPRRKRLFSKADELRAHALGIRLK